MIISKTVYRERKQRGNLLALKILDSFFFFPNESENWPWSVLGKA